MPNLNAKQFTPNNTALNATRGAAIGGIAAGLPGAAVGGIAGAAQSIPAVRTAERNVGNVAVGGAKGAVSGVKSAEKTFGPIGSIATGGVPEMIGGAAGAIRGAAASPAGRNIIQGAESGAKRGFGIAGPIGGMFGGGIGAIQGLFRNRSTQPATPATPATPVTPKTAVSPASSGAYTIQKGDTLWGIAQKNNTTVGALRAANPEFGSNPKYNNGNMIWSGGKVNLPGAPAAAAAPMQQAKVATPKPMGSMGNVATKPSTPLLNPKQMGGFTPSNNLPAQMGKPIGPVASPNLPAQMATPTTPVAPQSSLNLGAKINRMQP